MEEGPGLAAVRVFPVSLFSTLEQQTAWNAPPTPQELETLVASQACPLTGHLEKKVGIYQGPPS